MSSFPFPDTSSWQHSYQENIWQKHVNIRRKLDFSGDSLDSCKSTIRIRAHNSNVHPIVIRLSLQHYTFLDTVYLSIFKTSIEKCADKLQIVLKISFDAKSISSSKPQTSCLITLPSGLYYLQEGFGLNEVNTSS
jgi:hypothetical protein